MSAVRNHMHDIEREFRRQVAYDVLQCEITFEAQDVGKSFERRSHRMQFFLDVSDDDCRRGILELAEDFNAFVSVENVAFDIYQALKRYAWFRTAYGESASNLWYNNSCALGAYNEERH